MSLLTVVVVTLVVVIVDEAVAAMFLLFWFSSLVLPVLTSSFKALTASFPLYVFDLVLSSSRSCE